MKMNSPKRKVTDLLPTEAILISSDAERDAVLRLFHEAGIKWANGSSTIESYPSFDYPLGLELDINVLWNNSIYIYESIGRKILPATEFIPTEAEKVEVDDYWKTRCELAEAIIDASFESNPNHIASKKEQLAWDNWIEFNKTRNPETK